MLTALRAEVNALLAATPVRRKPALRRSDAPDALLATDLPFAADADAAADFIERAASAGWRVRTAENGWLLLDRDVPVPADAIPAEAPGECGCCLSLLARHPQDGDAGEMIRRVVKAQEAGWRTFERLCGQLHAELAEMLRLHEPLPGALIPYLAYAYVSIKNQYVSLTDGRRAT